MPPIPAAPTTPIEWWWWALTAGAVAAGLGIVLWALIWDRARGRLRCPRCWYDMAGQKAQRHEGTEAQSVECWRCPECGKHIVREKKLRKTRRKWRWALAAMVLLVIAPPGALIVQVNRIGLWQAMPDWALIQIVDWLGWPEPSTGFRSPFQFAPTPAVKAATAEDELYSRLTGYSLSRGATRWIFEHAPIEGINTRERWPIGVPILVKPPALSWIDFVRSDFLTFQTVNDEAGDLADGTDPGVAVWREQAFIELAPSKKLRTELEIEAALDLGAFATGGHLAGLVLSRRIKLPTEIVASIDDILAPIDESVLNQHLHQSVQVRIRRNRNMDPRVVIQLLPSYQQYDQAMRNPEANRVGMNSNPALPIELARALEQVAFGLQLQLRHGTSTLAWAFGMPSREELLRGYSLVFYGDLHALNHSDFSDPAWTLHVIGDGEMALRDFDKTKYWAGEFSIPMSQVEVARTRR